jgi:hypothetical protein
MKSKCRRPGKNKRNKAIVSCAGMVYTRGMEPNQNMPSPEKAQHDPPHIFDLTFKKLLSLSKPAVINLINGCFDRNYPLDSELEYLATENVTDELGHTFCDISLRVADQDDFILEAEAGNDSSMAIRIFEYGYRSGLKRKVVKKGHIIEIHLPYVMAIYWVPKNKVPDKEALRLIGPDGRFLDYEIKSFNFLEHSIKELEEKKMSVLLPFYVLKPREAVKAATTSEERQVLADETRGILEELAATVRHSAEVGLIDKGDVWSVFGCIKRLYDDAYKTYTEFKETETMVEDTYFKEYEDKIREAEEAAAARATAEATAEATAKAAERFKEIAQYLIGKQWDAREIAEATKLDMDTVQSLYAQG